MKIKWPKTLLLRFKAEIKSLIYLISIAIFLTLKCFLCTLFSNFCFFSPCLILRFIVVRWTFIELKYTKKTKKILTRLSTSDE